MKIQSLDQIQIGSELVDAEAQIHHVLAINTKGTEAVVTVQNYPHTSWYVTEVKCDKCGGISYLKFTSTSSEKLVCSHTIQKENNFYACNGKKYTEVSRRPTGIKCTSNILWADFIKQFNLK